jgi:hypothetical protein
VLPKSDNSTAAVAEFCDSSKYAKLAVGFLWLKAHILLPHLETTKQNALHVAVNCASSNLISQAQGSLSFRNIHLKADIYSNLSVL